jgi:hypothetical protein
MRETARAGSDWMAPKSATAIRSRRPCRVSQERARRRNQSHSRGGSDPGAALRPSTLDRSGWPGGTARCGTADRGVGMHADAASGFRDRFEPPSPVQARYIMDDAEHHGTKVPKGSAILPLTASGNRDERTFESPDVPRHPPQVRASPRPSATASNTASVQRWPGLRNASRSRRSSSGSQRGRSTGTTRSRRTPPTVRGWEELAVIS